MSAIVVIPARYDSTRFPGKPLALLKGMPLIQHVYRNSAGAHMAEDVIVATDSKAIYDKVLSFGGKSVMTSDKHISGTDRIAEVARSLNYDIIVNVQGDEPLIKPEMIDDVIALLDDKRASMGTLAKKIKDNREIFDPNVVKVVFDEEGFAFYFSRAPIPYHRDEWGAMNGWKTAKGKELNIGTGYRVFDCYKHVGIYSYRRDVLLKLSEMRPSHLEIIEKLEQLRALENSFKIKVKETYMETFGVDTPEDLERMGKCLNLSL
ncbi:MAG: 3-deoxy-manno-octulosonate cytidylyltransferase [Nitrospirota bacterium]